MHKASTWLILVLALLAGPLWSETYQTKPAEFDPRHGFRMSYYGVPSKAFSKPDPNSGCVSEHAVTAEVPFLGRDILLAIDCAKPGDKAPSVVRVDFTGKGDFTDAPTVPFHVRHTARNYYYAQIGPGSAEMDRDGDSIAISIRGYYNKRGDRRNMGVILAAARSAEMSFGDTKATVTLVDGTRNLKFNDPARVGQQNGRPVAIRASGDTVHLKIGQTELAVPYGSPVRMGGDWYTVTASEAGRQVTVEPYDGELGTVDLGENRVQRPLLVGTKHLLQLGNVAGKVALPADTYVVGNYSMVARDTGRDWTLQVPRGPGEFRKAKPFTVTPQATTSAALGEPLSAKANAQTYRRGANSPTNVRFSLELTDVNGLPVRGIYGPRGKRPDPPKLTVADASGKQVYQASMEYG
jgi:hypothetical protein